jgi:hypothetical protein
MPSLLGSGLFWPGPRLLVLAAGSCPSSLALGSFRHPRAATCWQDDEQYVYIHAD